MKCGAEIIIANENAIVKRHEGNRNHAPDPVKVEARKMLQRFCRFNILYIFYVILCLILL